MILLQNYVYLGDSEDPIIYIYDNTSLNEISSYKMLARGGITDMAMFASDVQPVTSSKLVYVYTILTIIMNVVVYL